MAKSLNKVTLIGNLTRDPELRYTPQGTAVCTFSLATNRQWTIDSGEKKEDAEFHRLVAWNKLAEICAQLLKKGRKVYVEGRLQTRSWQGQDGQNRYTTEVVISDMILLDNKREGVESSEDVEIPESALEPQVPVVSEVVEKPHVKEAPRSKEKKAKKEVPTEEPESDDIPF